MYYYKVHSKNRKHSRKKIAITIIISILVVLSAVFFLTPVSTVCRFYFAIKTNDIDKAIECVEPNKAAMLKDMNNLVSNSLFRTLVNSFLQNKDTQNNNSAGLISVDDYKIKNINYSWFNKTSSVVICLDIIDNSGLKSSLNLSVNFIRIDSRWYLDYISDTSLQLNKET